VRIDAEHLLEDPEGLVAGTVELRGGLVVVEDEGLAGSIFAQGGLRKPLGG
jgi:hypothetical protein